MASTRLKEKANIAVIGAGWWSQGWHIPHLHRNPGANLTAIVDSSPHPKSSLNPNLEPLSVLSDKYAATAFSSVSDLLRDPLVGPTLDGVIVATPHATHYAVGEEILKESQKRQAAGKSPIHILMEKRKSNRRLCLLDMGACLLLIPYYLLQIIIVSFSLYHQCARGQEAPRSCQRRCHKQRLFWH
jgi:hypothetical protein